MDKVTKLVLIAHFSNIKVGHHIDAIIIYYNIIEDGKIYKNLICHMYTIGYSIQFKSVYL